MILFDQAPGVLNRPVGFIAVIDTQQNDFPAVDAAGLIGLGKGGKKAGPQFEAEVSSSLQWKNIWFAGILPVHLQADIIKAEQMHKTEGFSFYGEYGEK